MTAPCPCGGETQVEHFDHPTGVQWFIRCIECGAMSDTRPSMIDAQVLVIEKAKEST